MSQGHCMTQLILWPAAFADSPRNMSGAVDGEEQPQSVLKVQGLRRIVQTQQEGDKVIIAGISFEVSTGEILFVTGKHWPFNAA